MRIEDMSGLIARVVGGATAFLGLVSSLYATLLNPEGNLILFIALAVLLLAVLTLGLLLWIQRRTRFEESLLEEGAERRVPFYSQEQRRHARRALCGIGLASFVASGVLIAIDLAITPSIDRVEVDSGDQTIVIVRGSGFGPSTDRLSIWFDEQERAPLSVAPEVVRVASPSGFTEGSVSIKRGPRHSNTVHFSFAGVVFDVAVVELINPIQTNPIQRLMDGIEPFPAFPYYSHSSDDPSAWPPRVFRDRETFAKLIDAFLQKPDVTEALEPWERSSGGEGLEVLSSGGRTDEVVRMERLSRIRMFFSQELGGDEPRLTEEFGLAFTESFGKLEGARETLKRNLPNRLMILRVENRQNVDARDFRAEIDVGGYVYDVTLNHEGIGVESLTWSPNHKVVEIDSFRPGYAAEIRVWYQYLPLEQRVFAGPADVIREHTQGITVRNLTISDGLARRDRTLLAHLEAYNRLDVDPTSPPDVP